MGENNLQEKNKQKNQQKNQQKTQDVSQLQKVRRDKLAELQAAGNDPAARLLWLKHRMHIHQKFISYDVFSRECGNILRIHPTWDPVRCQPLQGWWY